MTQRSLDDPRWLELIRHDEQATPFHHPAWAAAISATYGFESFLLTAETGEQLEAGLPIVEIGKSGRERDWISLPFTDSCFPVGRPEAFERLMGELEAARSADGIRRLEVRGPLPLAASRNIGFVTQLVPLDPDPEVVERCYRPAVRRNIRRAKQAGARVRLAESETELTHVFYDLQVITRRRLGLPVQPRRFFREIWRRLAGAGLCRVLLVELGDRVVAGGVFLCWNSQLVYKYGASDHRFWSARPNNLLFAEAIRWGCQNGYTRLDLGRTDVTSESLRQFKQGWGGDEVPLEYTLVGAGGLVRHDLPPILRFALRRSPKWLVRLAGEAVYRRAA